MLALPWLSDVVGGVASSCSSGEGVVDGAGSDRGHGSSSRQQQCYRRPHLLQLQEDVEKKKTGAARFLWRTRGVLNVLQKRQKMNARSSMELRILLAHRGEVQ